MNDPGKIQDLKLDELFSDIIDHKVIISLRIEDTGYERLTCVVGIEREWDAKYLLIDKPDGFEKAVQKNQAWRLHFNFNGPDRLEYFFSTRGGDIFGSNLKIPFPEYVERLQRRRDFRINTLPGTKMVFVDEDCRGVISLINISLGGAFGVLMKHNKKGVKGSLFTVDQALYKVGIIFPMDKDRDEQVVIINKVDVRRIEHDADRQIYKYAFQFLERDKEQQQKLIQAIYRLQRHFLKNR